MTWQDAENAWGEERQQLEQRIATAERKVANMTVRLTDGGLDTLSLCAAQLIEDQFAQHHPGGRLQRLAKVQVIVREALREIATGEKLWNAWQPGAIIPAPERPTAVPVTVKP